MIRSRKLLFAAAFFGAALMGSTSAYSAEIDVDASMAASAAVTVAKNADISFGGIDYAGSHNGAVQVGPDGNAATVGGGGLTLSGTPTAGEIAVTSNADTIEITCDAAGIVSDGTVDVDITEVVWDQSNAANYGAATNTCAGLGAGTVTIDTGVTNDPTLYIGAELTVDADELLTTSGTFDTSTGNGDPITFRIVYQ